MHPTVVLALTMAAVGLTSRAASPDPEPTCTGTLAGKRFTTSYLLPDGYHLEGVWKLRFGDAGPGAPGQVSVDVQLTTLFESDSATPFQREIELREPWHMKLAGRDASDAVKQVVDLWCSAVLRALSAGAVFGRAPSPNRGRIT